MSFNSDALRDVITRYIQLDAPTGTGWRPVLCKVCNDRGHKGKRAGFKFDHDKVAYHCFNCGHAAIYDPHENKKMPRKMVEVLRAFNVPDEEWQQVLFASLVAHDQHGNRESARQHPQTHIEPPTINPPNIFYFLKDAKRDDKWAEIARFYLQDRNVDPNSYPFMLSRKTSTPHLKKWFGRVIIPIYKDNRLIFYIGRDLTGKATKKYESPSVSRERVLCGFERLFEHTDIPLYVVEGWFDAQAIDGVAILGNELSDAQITWLNRSRRKKVYIPDRFGSGFISAKQALKQGWCISTPDIGSCKDISEANDKYGRLYVMKTIADNTVTGFEAEARLGVYCNDKDRR